MENLRYLSTEECFILHGELREWARSWLIRGGIDSPLHLANWARMESAFVVRNGPNYVVIITDWYPGLKATLHPLFRNRRLAHNDLMLSDIVKSLHSVLDVVRLQVNVGSKAGKSVRGVCLRAGFQFEGISRMANRLGSGEFEDLEIWSHIGGLNGNR